MTANPVGDARLDWVLLLPAVGPNPTVVVLGGAGPATMERLRRHFDTDTVLKFAPPVGPIDVLVVAADHDGDATAFVDRLAPDGVAFVAGSHRRRRLVRRLGSGRTIVRYVTAPSAEAPRRYVPLAHHGAIRWYLDELFFPVGVVQRAARTVLHAAPRAARVVIRQQAAVVGPSGRPELLDAYASTATDGDRSNALVVLTSGHDAGSRAIAMPFTRDGRRGRHVVKVSTRPSAHDVIREEQRILGTLATELPPELRDAVPAPGVVFEWRHHLAASETARQGPTVERVLRTAPTRDAQVAMLGRVAGWLTDLHRGTAESIRWDVAAADRHVGSLVERFRGLHETDPAVDALLERIVTRSHDLTGSVLPIVRRHFDYAPWNMVAGANGLGVVDWETGPGRPSDGRGLPVCDLDYFVKYWLHICMDATSASAEALLSVHRPPTSAIERSCYAPARSILAAYCADLDVDPRFVPVLTTCNWAEHAVNDALRADRHGQQRSSGSGALTALGRLAADADDLFALWDAAPANRSR